MHLICIIYSKILKILGPYCKYECVQVNHHKDVGRIIEEWEGRGWRLKTYQAAGIPNIVNHYLLFEIGD